MNNKLELKRKTGFKINNPEVPVIINDYRGKVFYNNSELKNRTAFNLPKGIYFIKSGNFSMLERPVLYKKNKLPLPERLRAWPFDFKVIFAFNPQKATINWTHKVIIFDNRLRDKSLPELYYILFHEFAHSKFKTETLTDALAENMMINFGFNPSQIAKAPITSLSDKQVVRKTNAVKRLIDRKNEH